MVAYKRKCSIFSYCKLLVNRPSSHSFNDDLSKAYAQSENHHLSQNAKHVITLPVNEHIILFKLFFIILIYYL